MNVLERRLEFLEEEKREILAQIDESRARKLILCKCGSKHRINTLTVIQTYWYTPSRGCMEGDHWNASELQFICPSENFRNRILFSNSEIDWENRNKIAYNPEMQFSRLYKHLFKEVIDLYKDGGIGVGKLPWRNNYWIDENKKRFGLYIRSNK